MMKNQKNITEIFWLFSPLIISICAVGIVNGFENLWEKEVDIPMHNTYFVTSSFSVITSLFLLLTYVIYLFRQIINKFYLILPNIILLLVTFMLVILTTIAIREISSLKAINNGWNIYPAVNDMPDKIIKENTVFIKIISGMNIVRVILILTIIAVGFQIGKKIKNRLVV